MNYSATACGRSSPDLTFDRQELSNSVQWVVQEGPEAVQNQTDGTVYMQHEREDATSARGPEEIRCG